MFKKTGKTTTIGIAEPIEKKPVIGSVEGSPEIKPLDKDPNIPRPTENK